MRIPVATTMSYYTYKGYIKLHELTQIINIIKNKETNMLTILIKQAIVF